jgi:hypothetical protein
VPESVADAVCSTRGLQWGALKLLEKGLVSSTRPGAGVGSGAERQPGSQRELHSGDGHYQLHRGGSAGGAYGVSRSPQRRLWRETVLPGGAAAYNLMLGWRRGNLNRRADL